MPKENLNVFVARIGGKIGAVVVAYNRGHAAKLIAKAVEELGYKLTKDDPIEKIDLTTEQVQLFQPNES